ncbi:MAG: U32 family peptidase, partial [Butyrivibrio sp.]|nr:U32 family peptidase [Butyrivibrio sp.]
VHGALCYSYSGQCLISSFLGGRSGNRGRCAGTCRLMYEAKGERRALLSLKDLCALEILPKLLDAGVYSLKIEGRMKSAEYAAGVTSIYRRYVDMYLSGEAYSVEEDDLKRLLLLFDRGGMTKGFFFMHNGADMIADADKSDKSQAQKAEYENLIKLQYIGKNLKEKIKVSVKLFEGKAAIMSLSDSEGNCVSVSGERAERALGCPLSREDIAKQICRFGNTDYEAESLEIEADESVFMPNKALNGLRRRAAEALSEARLAAFRRAAAKPLSGQYADLDGGRCARSGADGAGAVSEGSGGGCKISVRAMTVEQAQAALSEGADRICAETELMSLEETARVRGLCAEAGAECFLAMPRIMREGRTSFIEDKTEFLRKLEFDGFLIRNPAEYEYLRKNGFEGLFSADYTVYAFNDEAVRALFEQGYSEIVCSAELNAAELAGLASPVGRELMVYMRTPLMISAGCIDKTLGKCHAPKASFGVLRDRKGAKLKYLCCCKYCYNILYNSVPTVLTDRVSEIKRLAPDRLGLAFADETGEQVREAVRAARMGARTEFAQGEASSVGFTRGHFSRGVE